jgi:hypothetical protein
MNKRKYEPERQAEIKKMLLLLYQKPAATPFNELLKEHTQASIKEEQEKLKAWNESSKKLSCVFNEGLIFPKFFLQALDLDGNDGSTEGNCQYTRFFEVSNVFICKDNLVSFRKKETDVEYKKLKKGLSKKYGEPKELASYKEINLPDRYQLYTLFHYGENYILLTNTAESEKKSKPFGKKVSKLPPSLKYGKVSTVYYFTDKLFEALKKDKKISIKLQKKQEDKENKLQRKQEEELDNKALENL